MKAIIFIVCMCIVSASFAGETDTECPWMKEQNERSNPKASQTVKVKSTKKGTVSSQ